MTTNEITTTARKKVLEPTDGIISDDQVLLYANLAYQDVWKQAFTSNKVTSTSIVCANGVCTLPSNFGRAYGPCEDSAENFYYEYSIADFHRENFEYGFTIENGQLLTNKTDITALTLKYYVVPETLTASVDPSIDSHFHEPIMYGVVYRLYEDLQDEENALYYKEIFKTDLAERLANQSTYEEENITGGEMFTYQNLII